MVPCHAPVSLMALHCCEARGVWQLHPTSSPSALLHMDITQLSSPFPSEGLRLSPRDPSEIPSPSLQLPGART